MMVEFTPTELMYLSVARDDNVEYLAQCDVDVFKVFELLHKLIKQYKELEKVVINYQDKIEQ